MTNRTPRYTRRTLLERTAGAAGILATLPLADRRSAHAGTATPAADHAGIEAAIAETMAAMAIPGAVVLVERAGSEPWLRGFGVADLDTGTPMVPAMHMRAGSITKTMTATLVLQLMDEGLLTLDDTLADVLPERAGFPHAGTMTIRHLLGMRSGAFDYLDDEAVFPEIMADPGRLWTPDELIDISAAHEPAFPPGEEFAYSNTNYILLGMLIEHLTEQAVADAMAVRLFEPLGLAHTSLPSTPDLPDPFAHGYSVDPTGTTDAPVDWTWLHPSVAWAAGGAVSTAGDLLAWLRALVDGSLISGRLQTERMSFVPVRPGYRYGLGIADYDGMVGHEGSILGFHSFAGHDATTGDTVIVLANLDPAGGHEDAATAITAAIRETFEPSR